MVQPRVHINNISKTFFDPNKGDIEAIKSLDISIQANEIYCLLGPSGCGKSTALNLVAGFGSPTSGNVLLNGKPIDKPGPERAMVFQTPTLFPWLTVLGNVNLGLSIGGVVKAEATDLSMRYLDDIGLSGFENRYPYDLSGGMQQRVALARAWVNTPDVLLLDEPFGALDAQTRVIMQELLLDLWTKHGTTILFVTHDIEEAIFLGDRIGVMSKRPGIMKEEITIDISRPRSIGVNTTPEFIQYKERILGQLYEEWKP